jgi:hypothetical protein
MPELLLPVGSHFFTADALKKAVDEAAIKFPGKRNVLSAQVDASGIKTVLMLGSAASDDKQWKVYGAFTHDWANGNTFAGGGSVAW